MQLNQTQQIRDLYWVWSAPCPRIDLRNTCHLSHCTILIKSRPAAGIKTNVYFKVDCNLLASVWLQTEKRIVTYIFELKNYWVKNCSPKLKNILINKLVSSNMVETSKWYTNIFKTLTDYSSAKWHPILEGYITSDSWRSIESIGIKHFWFKDQPHFRQNCDVTPCHFS